MQIEYLGTESEEEVGGNGVKQSWCLMSTALGGGWGHPCHHWSSDLTAVRITQAFSIHGFLGPVQRPSQSSLQWGVLMCASGKYAEYSGHFQGWDLGDISPHENHGGSPGMFMILHLLIL